jgi:tRNA pseudouridine38-40 synthase
MPAHIDLPRAYEAGTVRDALNHHLRPAPIAVLAAQEVDETFHARFSARARHYEYRIVNRRGPLDADAMREAAQALTGRHDFSTFRAAQCQSVSPVKTLSALDVRRDGERVVIAASAPSFLHHQVRSIAGSLVEVGLGRWSARDLVAALEARDRARCGQVAPPEGLYFARADYDAMR